MLCNSGCNKYRKISLFSPSKAYGLYISIDKQKRLPEKTAFFLAVGSHGIEPWTL